MGVSLRARRHAGRCGCRWILVGDVVDDPAGRFERSVGEPGVEEAVEIAFVRHAERSLRTVRASASSAARMARWAWWSRDRAVPAGMPRVSAISDGAYPRKWCRTRIARCSGGIRRNPRSSRSRSAIVSSVVGCRRPVDRQQPQVRGAATLARRLGDADMDDEAGQPRIEPVRIAEVPEVTPGDHQRVLEGVLGPVDVTEDPLGGGEQPVAAHADQVDECRLVAALCRRQQFELHRGPRSAPFGGRVPTLLGIRRAQRSIFVAGGLVERGGLLDQGGIDGERLGHRPEDTTRTWSRLMADGCVTPAIARARSISSR